MNREAQMHAFLQQHGWGDAQCRMLAGDASFRKYWRITRGEQQRVLMDAPPEHEDIRPFMAVAETLAKAGLRVAHMEAADAAQGWLLLEDLGDDSFTKLLQKTPQHESEIYRTAIDALVHLHEAAPEIVLKPYDDAVYLREAALLPEWFLPQIVGMPAARDLREEYLEIWRGILKCVPLQQRVLVHRDYHADNLLWQPGAQGFMRVGMLDFQDALLGDAAYDIVSLLEDARRDVGRGTVESCITHYLERSDASKADFMARYAVLGAQRNSKIIGIFTRLTVRDGKAHYLNYLPRVWGHFMRDVQHPVLQPLQQWVEKNIPEEKRTLTQADAAIGGIVVAA